MSSSSKTVVIGLNWVGDNVLALPTYRALHHRFRQEGGISVAAPEHIASLLASTGIFRRVIAWNGDTRDRIRLLKEGRFRPSAELRAIYDRLGAAQASELVASCGSGVTACHTLLALELAGLPRGKLYVGSWSDWSSQPGVPIATGADPG